MHLKNKNGLLGYFLVDLLKEVFFLKEGHMKKLGNLLRYLSNKMSPYVLDEHLYSLLFVNYYIY